MKTKLLTLMVLASSSSMLFAEPVEDGVVESVEGPALQEEEPAAKDTKEQNIKQAGDASQMDTIVVTASASEHRVITAPASVQVVTSEEIMRLPIKTTADLLKTLPGITNYSTAGGRESLVMRGLDEDYVLRLQDGKRVSSSNGLWRAPAFDYTPIPLAAIDRIEVVYGPMSALYGSDAIGGVINTITKKPQDEWITSINLEAGIVDGGEDGDHYRGSVYANGKLNDALGLVVSAEVQNQDAWIDEDLGVVAIEPQEALKGWTTLSWDLNAQQRLEFDLAHDDVDIEEHSNDGGASSRAQSVDRWSYGVTHYGDWQWGRSEVLLHHSDADITDFNTRYVLQPPLKREINETGTTARASAFFDIGSSNSITLGTEYLNTEVTDPVQYPGGGKGDSLSISSVFIQDELAVTDNLIATLGVRAEDAEAYGTHVSPRVYLVYSLSDSITVKGGVGSAFRAPTLFESSESFSTVSCGGNCSLVGNPDLEEETGISKEVSLLLNYERWGASFTVFQNDLENMINVAGADPLPGGGLSDRYYENVDEAKLTGLEVATALVVTSSLNLDVNYSFLDTELNGDAPIVYRPEHTANAKLNWLMTDKISSYAQASYYGDYVHATRTKPYTEFSGYTTADLGVQFQVSKGLVLRTGLTNLTDEQPRENDPESYLYLKGRTLFAGMQWDF